MKYQLKRGVFLGICTCCIMFVPGIPCKGEVMLGKNSQSVQMLQKKKVSKKVRDKFFSQSAFIGNSIAVGQKLYFGTQGENYLGNPKMLVQGCYSFLNDETLHSQYSLVYKGQHYRAKDALKKAKVKRVFINMGTNDLWKPVEKTYEDYVSYITGIREKNPKLIIFIESTTPMCTASNRKYLNNDSIHTLNRLMKKYCKEHKDIYYIDITTGMRDKSGGLKEKYSSDGYVHMTMAGYELWTENLIKYVDKLLIKEQEAQKAVEKAKKTKRLKDYKRAKKLVNKLDSSTKKSQLKKKLKKIKRRILSELAV